MFIFNSKALQNRPYFSNLNKIHFPKSGDDNDDN